MSNLQQELDSYQEWDPWPEAWFPKPGESLVGEVIQYGWGRGRAFDGSRFWWYPLVMVERETDGNTFTVWLSRAMLRDAFGAPFSSNSPVTWDGPQGRVGIKYFGQKKDQRKTHLYLVRFDTEGVPEAG